MSAICVRFMPAYRCLVEERFQFLCDEIASIPRLFFQNDENIVTDRQLRQLLIGIPEQPLGAVSLNGGGDSAFRAYPHADQRKLVRQRPKVELSSSNPAPVALDGEKSGGVSESLSSRV